jgi:hypothetical protein
MMIMIMIIFLESKTRKIRREAEAVRIKENAKKDKQIKELDEDE